MVHESHKSTFSQYQLVHEVTAWLRKNPKTEVAKKIKAATTQMEINEIFQREVIEKHQKTQ